MIRSTDLYIDLGTSNTLVYGRGRGFMLNEPSIIAMRQKNAYSTEIFGLGRPAKAMLGKSPECILVERPLKEGVIANFDATSKMLWSFLKRVKKNASWFRPRMIISLPCEVSEFEKRAVQDVGMSLGASRVDLLAEPMAAAIGAGLPVLSSRGHMVVDIGGGTTEIAVISLGGIVAQTAVRIGGNTIDSAIIDLLQNQFRFLIGELTAEKMKLSIAQAEVTELLSIEVGGFDLNLGLPRKCEFTSQMILPAVQQVLKQISASVSKTLSEIPPELSSDIIENGIVLAGGGALVKNMRPWLEQEIGVPVHIAEEPLFSVARGGAKALEDHRLFDALDPVKNGRTGGI